MQTLRLTAHRGHAVHHTHQTRSMLLRLRLVTQLSAWGSSLSLIILWAHAEVKHKGGDSFTTPTVPYASALPLSIFHASVFQCAHAGQAVGSHSCLPQGGAE